MHLRFLHILIVLSGLYCLSIYFFKYSVTELSLHETLQDEANHVSIVAVYSHRGGQGRLQVTPTSALSEEHTHTHTVTLS